MNAREQKGIIIAAMTKLTQTKDCWLVPSQTGNGKVYTVDPVACKCSCPDHQEWGHKCKHLYAVEITVKREISVSKDGTVTETNTASVTFTEKKKYTQVWSAYNEAQQHEKDHFQELLADLCSAIPEPARKGGSKGGRPPVLMRDALFTCIYKVFSTFSARRFASDLREAHNRGHVTQDLSIDIAWKYLRKPEVTPILQDLIVRSSLPLKSVEVNFAIDSSGFATSKFERWFDERWGVTRRKTEWVKVHACCGTRTHVVTAVVVGDKHLGDCPQLPELTHKTREGFTIQEMSADKAYLSADNLTLLDRLGIAPYIPFKVNSVLGDTPVWNKMFHFFNLKRDEFFQHYHRRSNIESAFSMMKRKHGDAVRSRSEIGIRNEALAKIVCHNLCCVIQEWYELGIDPTAFGVRPMSLQKSVETEILRFPTPCG